jgi:hypothetical protein
MKKFISDYAILFVLTFVLVLSIGLLLSLPVIIAIDEANPLFLWLYVPYVIVAIVTILIMRNHEN